MAQFGTIPVTGDVLISPANGGGGIRGVLFDKDGTLVDFRKTWLPAYAGVADELAAAIGRPVLATELLRRMGYDPVSDSFAEHSPLLWATNAMIAEHWSQSAEIADLDVLEVIERHFNDLDRYPPAPVGDLAALLARLRQRGLRLGLATMDSTRQAERTAALLGIRHELEFVAGCDAGFGVKPDPGMVLAFCAACGLQPRVVAMIGDTPADLEMARRAGCGLIVGVLTGGAAAPLLAQLAHHVLDDVMAIESLLEPA
jgi:phosphoglycolate phosphatase